MFRDNLSSLVDLALMSPYACELTSEDIFFGAVNAILRLATIKLSDKQLKILLEITEGWKRGEKGCMVIE